MAEIRDQIRQLMAKPAFKGLVDYAIREKLTSDQKLAASAAISAMIVYDDPKKQASYVRSYFQRDMPQNYGESRMRFIPALNEMCLRESDEEDPGDELSKRLTHMPPLSKAQRDAAAQDDFWSPPDPKDVENNRQKNLDLLKARATRPDRPKGPLHQPKGSTASGGGQPDVFIKQALQSSEQGMTFDEILQLVSTTLRPGEPWNNREKEVVKFKLIQFKKSGRFDLWTWLPKVAARGDDGRWRAKK